METVISVIKAWQLHPLADHFTVAILTVAVLVDLVAMLFSTRLWMRYMALTLTIMGALAAVFSYLSGVAEAQRIGEAVSGTAKDVLIRHAWWGQYLMYAFVALAVWRLGLQAFNFLAGSRMTYTIAAVTAIVVLFWQMHLGDVLLYTYGVGTQLMGAATAPVSTASEPAGTLATSTASPTPVVPVVVETATRTITPAPTATATTTPIPTPAVARPSPTSTAPAAAPSATAARSALL